jgi:hypothetical protein
MSVCNGFALLLFLARITYIALGNWNVSDEKSVVDFLVCKVTDWSVRRNNYIGSIFVNWFLFSLHTYLAFIGSCACFAECGDSL